MSNAEHESRTLDLGIDEITVAPDRFRPEVNEEHVAALMASIKRTGGYEPIAVVMVDGKPVLVDGLNRLTACKRLGHQTVRANLWPGDPRLGEIELNTHRQAYGLRDIVRIGEWARAYYAIQHGGDRGEVVDIADDTQECPRALLPGEKPNDVGEALAMLGVTRSRRQYYRIQRIVETGIPLLIDSVDKGKYSVRAAYEIAKLPKEKQEKAMRKHEGLKEQVLDIDDLRDTDRERNKVKSQVRKEERKKRITAASLVGKRHWILAIPREEEEWATLEAATLDDFGLPDCVVVFGVTLDYSDRALRVLRGWGITGIALECLMLYDTAVRRLALNGYSAMLIIGWRGRPSVMRRLDCARKVDLVNLSEHPYQICRELSPQGWLDLFPRGKHTGFTPAHLGRVNGGAYEHDNTR